MKLRKIMLREGNEVLEQGEMKLIRGGEDSKSCNISSCAGTCKEFIPGWNIYKEGYCQGVILPDGNGNEYLACGCKVI